MSRIPKKNITGNERIAASRIWFAMWAEFRSVKQSKKTDDRLIFGQKSLRTTIQTKSCALKILLIISFSSDRSENNINAAPRIRLKMWAEFRSKRFCPKHLHGVMLLFFKNKCDKENRWPPNYSAKKRIQSFFFLGFNITFLTFPPVSKS